jgi:starvation-inducible outer membrane lipoprotein
MKLNVSQSSIFLVLCLAILLSACSTPPSRFGVYQQSDGTIGVHSPKDAKEEEAQEMALAECKKLGKRTATIIDSRKRSMTAFR